jgi:serine/threonine-protein kinase
MMKSVADTLIGQRLFGGYVVSRRIGAGGMGAVYLVENQELGKRLALKVLLADRSKVPDNTARFLAEARAASAIHHRNIIEIIDSSRLEDGRHYILMEHLEGDTLRRFARQRRPLGLETVLALLAQVCSGLQAAHARGIVHRDLKPSNIFVAPRPDNPFFIKILDFGIAKLEDPLLAGDVHTRTHTVAGTPNYMSPEQARALRDVDHRTDIYAVGVIAYELIVGRPPYNAHSVGELVYQQGRNRPPMPSKLRSGIPEAWDVLIASALATDRDHRPASAHELALLMIEATPGGEEIARAAAPLLFSPSGTQRSHRSSQSMATVTAEVQKLQQQSLPARPGGGEARERLHSHLSLTESMLAPPPVAGEGGPSRGRGDPPGRAAVGGGEPLTAVARPARPRADRELAGGDGPRAHRSREPTVTPTTRSAHRGTGNGQEAGAGPPQGSGRGRAGRFSRRARGVAGEHVTPAAPRPRSGRSRAAWAALGLGICVAGVASVVLASAYPGGLTLFARGATGHSAQPVVTPLSGPGVHPEAAPPVGASGEVTASPPEPEIRLAQPPALLVRKLEEAPGEPVTRVPRVEVRHPTAHPVRPSAAPLEEQTSAALERGATPSGPAGPPAAGPAAARRDADELLFQHRK